MTASWVAIGLVSVATLIVGVLSLRLSRTTSDIFVASRTVGPVVNASAVSGEYLSAASFLGVAGLVLLDGTDAFWYPVGWTAGYLVLLLFVAAPLRRSRAYTVPDFAEFRLESLAARRVSSAMVVLIGMFYLVPQIQAAGLTLRTVTGAPRWAGGLIAVTVVLITVVSGGMRSITLTQAFQYWLKLVALLVPLLFLLVHWGMSGGRSVQPADWIGTAHNDHQLYRTYSLIVATFLGTMGLPHVVVRFYTSRDGRAARRTIVVVLVMLSGFYLLPTMFGLLGRIYAPDLMTPELSDTVVMELPSRVFADPVASQLLTALIAAGAFAAFLSTASGLVMAVSGVIAQDLVSRRVPGVNGFRIAGTATALVAGALALAPTGASVAYSVELAFAIAASTFCPLLLLGIWWRGLTPVGAVIGLLVGGGSSAIAVLVDLFGPRHHGWIEAVAAQPALLTVPLAFGAMIGGSLLTRHRLPPHRERAMVRLHTPEGVTLDRGTFHPERSRRR